MSLTQAQRSAIEEAKKEIVRRANRRLEAQGDPLATKKAWKIPENVDGATPERVRHAGGTYEAPETTQTTKRDYGRIRHWYETLILKGSLPDELATAARDVSMYWHATNDPTGIVGSYGNQRWNGTPVGQVNAPAILGPEWRETARRRLMVAKLSVTKPRDLDYLCTAIEHNAGITEVASICAAHRETVSAGLKRALTEIAREWGYLQQYRPPTR